MFALRPAHARDLQAIDDIYNHYVVHSVATMQLEPEPISAREHWFSQHDAAHPVLVAVEGAEVIGWASLSLYKSRAGYARTVESSVYVRHDRHRRGVGRALMIAILARANQHGHHIVVAGVESEQHGSLALHESLGFARVAHFSEVGYKHGAFRDIVYLQRSV
jgi:L-amino acid N-acyltransferase YncA